MIVKRLQFLKIDDSKEWEVCMAVSYNKLWKLMIDKKVNKTDLTHMAGISTNAMAKLGRDEDVRVNILEKICLALNCKLDDIVEIVPDSGAVEE